MNTCIGVHVYFQIRVFSRYTLMNVIAGSCNSTFFLKKMTDAHRIPPLQDLELGRRKTSVETGPGGSQEAS